MEKQKTDLRVIRTKAAIRKAFCDMVLEMEYSDITVKALTQQAMINRNTFYLHYASIDALLEDLENEIAQKFLSFYLACKGLQDVDIVIRNCLEYVMSQPPFHERIFFSSSYRFVAERINHKIMKGRKAVPGGLLGMSETAEDIALAYCGSVVAMLFRKWVSDGKQMPPEELIRLATQVIHSGIDSIIWD